MNQNLLLKYISGKASQREKEEVAAWIDADAANLKEFMSLQQNVMMHLFGRMRMS